MTIRLAAETPWYDLFSRGARDWLRHNEKVRDAVKDTLPELLSSADLMTGSGSRTVAVPVKFLEHSRLRLSDASVNQGAGQGRGEPGDVLQPGREEGDQALERGDDAPFLVEARDYDRQTAVCYHPPVTRREGFAMAEHTIVSHRRARSMRLWIA